jgi:ribonuclease HII
MIIPDLKLEESLWKDGYIKVCGLDDFGRGPLAGPVVAGAVVVEKKEQYLDGVRDSKTMTEKKRDYFFEKIKEVCSGWGIGIVHSDEIDRLGISKAIQKAMVLAVQDIGFKPDFLITDGNIGKVEDYPTRTLIDGDALHYSISAASVIAKVTRDRMMKEYSLKYPGYGFEKNVGYGTKIHMEGLKSLGPCEIHRKCFNPVAKFFEK